MDDKQIAFIICTNNDLYYQECVRYIHDLRIPKGYNTDIICVQEASSMAEGYNAGMKSANAKYKVYLHQDTFILNKNFIYDMLDIFKDTDVGMIGMIGSDYLPSNANCYYNWNIGLVEAYNGKNHVTCRVYQNPKGCSEEVEAVDGLLMATQYDAEWREDFLDGWDFYDVSQSIEMRKKGYKVVVPYQKTAWCYHDCGPSKLNDYNVYRIKMFDEYPDIFYGNIDDIQEEDAAQKKKSEELIKFFEEGKFEELIYLANKMSNVWIQDAVICEIFNLMEIYSMENKTAGSHSIWYSWDSWKQVDEYYRYVRLLIMRVAYIGEDEQTKQLKEDVTNGLISKEAVVIIAGSSLTDITGVLSYFCET